MSDFAASEPDALSRWLSHAAAGRTISTRDRILPLDLTSAQSPFGEERERLRGRSVVLFVGDMATAAAALIDLDGFARRILLCPPAWDAEKLGRAAALAEADALVCDEGAPATLALPRIEARWPLRPVAKAAAFHETEWVLPTSGTSGPPKLAVHTLRTLSGAIGPGPRQEWATFYDIRRYGGLQIFLRALAGDGSLRLAGPDEPVDSFLDRLAGSGFTHISGTPTHWRRALMAGAATKIAPRYVRLSGEIADDAALSALATAFPESRIEHAYASTEAGVAFAVADGRAGFPAALLERREPVEMRIIDGGLRVRSARRALRVLGAAPESWLDAEGFVDTGDIVERRGDRFHFLGRRGGVINVGGAKVHPEDVEAVLNGLDMVRASRVYARSSPITGALVAADVVLTNGVNPDGAERVVAAAARARLPSHMAPAHVKIVAALPMTDGGKLARHG